MTSKKAYDAIWKHEILKDLQNIGLKHRLPVFISNFLSNRTFRVCIGSTLSDIYKQEEGVPQGSILSTTLFNVKINNIAKEITSDINGSLYIDELTISYRSKYIHTIERKLQYCINKINSWATNNGFKISKTKTKCIHFCNKRNDLNLKLEGENIPFVNQHKFLGIIFDKKALQLL